MIDLEWNQPAAREKTVTEPVVLNGEIIRIGAVRLDSSLNMADSFHMSVLPKYYKKMNSSVGRVTGLGTSALTYGHSFTCVYKYFTDWCRSGDGEYCLLSWGSEDERILRSNITVHGMNPEEFPRIYDMQQIFGYKVTGDGKQHGVQAALDYYGLESELKAHDALNDAIYAARIGREIPISRYIGEYDEMLAEIERKKSIKYYRCYKNVGSISAAVRKKKIMQRICPVCEAEIDCTKWIEQDENTLVAFGECVSHGGLMLRIRIKHDPDGEVCAVKQIKAVTAEEREGYMRKLFGGKETEKAVTSV